MKRSIIVITVFILAVFTNLSAQIEVEKSATPVSFSVGVSNGTPMGTYNWTKSTGPAITNLATVQSDVDNSVNVEFNGNIGDQATLTVYGISSDGCKGNDLSQTYIIVNPNDLSYKATVSVNNSSICPATDNNTGVTAGVVTYTVEFTDDANNPVNVISFVYQLGANSAVTVPVASASSSTFQLTFNNEQAGTQTLYINRVSVSATEGSLFTSNRPSVDVNVSKAPIVTGL